MKQFVIKRLVHLIAVLIGISLLSFILANIAPIDPAEAYVRSITKAPTAEMLEQYREKFGFNRSVHEQYLLWLKNAIHMDFGVSYTTGKPAMRILLGGISTTLTLAGISCLLIPMFGCTLGILAAHREGTCTDKIIIGISFFSISVPGYFLGLICLLIFGIHLKIMPIVGHDNPEALLCAAFVLSFPMIGSLSRILRTLLLETKSSPYVMYAKARGISRRNIMFNHLLRNAAPPCIVMFGNNIGYLLAGTAIVESIFSFPGTGKIALNAALNRDFPVINAYIVMMGVCFVLCNMAAETAGLMLNPRLLRRDCT